MRIFPKNEEIRIVGFSSKHEHLRILSVEQQKKLAQKLLVEAMINLNVSTINPSVLTGLVASPDKSSPRMSAALMMGSATYPRASPSESINSNFRFIGSLINPNYGMRRASATSQNRFWIDT